MTEFVLAILALGAGVFAASSATKLRSRAAYREFRAGLRATGLVPNSGAVPLVAAEAVCAVVLTAAAASLAAGAAGAAALAEAALSLACALTAALAARVAVVIRHGVRAPCRCFGATSARPLGAAHLVRNACLLLLMLAGLAADPLGYARPAAGGSVLAVLAGLVVALLFTRWDDLVSLFGPATPG